jgi:hypothetical protein
MADPVNKNRRQEILALKKLQSLLRGGPDGKHVLRLHLHERSFANRAA